VPSVTFRMRSTVDMGPIPPRIPTTFDMSLIP
jgi:hypothetical protein